MIQDDELRAIFKTASEEHLQNLDTGLLYLESHPTDPQTLESLLRDAHSLKGDANMLGVKDIGTLAHQIEHLLSDLKEHPEPISSELSDRLSHALHAIRALVEEATTGKEAHVNTFRVLAELMGSEEVAEGKGQEQGSREAEEQEEVDHIESLDAEPAGIEDRSLVEMEQPTATAEAMSIGAMNGKAMAMPKPSEPNPGVRAETAPGYRIGTIRVATENLDSLLTQAGELTVTKIRIAHRLAELEAVTTLWDEWNRDLFNNRFVFDELRKGNGALNRLAGFHNRTEERLDQLGNKLQALRSSLSEDTARLELISDELEEDIRTLRLLPLSTLFNVFPRMVRDLARQEGKQVNFVVEGGDTRADKRILEEMKDPLMHILRNAIDHGLEPPEERQRCGKSPTATLRLRGYQTPTMIVLEVSDDGRGLDVEKIKRTALKRGFCHPDELDAMSPSQIQELIFAPGFSTAPLVTEVSGRGVGLDVVRTNVEKLKGAIALNSTPRKGCTIRIQLGLTLATAHVLIVMVNDRPYAIPVEAVQTATLVEPQEIFMLEGRPTIVRDDQPLSIAPLAQLLELPEPNNLTRNRNRSQRQPCIILSIGGDRLGVCVDALIDEQDVVTKPQSKLLKRVRNISGATILGTGEVCMVLNPVDLMKSVRRQAVAIAPTETHLEPTQKQRVLLVEDSIATRTQEKRILESAGYEVITAVDGLDGFNKLQSRPFDAVVSDVQMPNLDGLSLAARIRQHREYNEIPIILVTSLASDEDKRRGAEAGANAYITKGSFNQNVLLETLHRLI
ncbi:MULTISPECIES: response regulator [unclassified Leptolyngbya]|uniref:response regulator n=1 Tax=unclassified Leptolyngbya TaxID=2650499 RepID=UPI0016853F6A|nr:hybrid sensor histidine kinase/response regulator [Leptolyngbya sp. FACHB-8]MBD2153474.1 hybrid sensor histidine kinase/response regulator [Leptolyngbya sp. FACHB-16]